MLFSSTDTYQDPDPYLDVFQIRIPSRRPLNTDPEFTYGSNSTVFAVDEGGGGEKGVLGVIPLSYMHPMILYCSG